MSPKVTLYIKDGDHDVWTRARKLAEQSDRSLSDLTTAALVAYVNKEEGVSSEMFERVLRRVTAAVKEEVEKIFGEEPAKEVKTAHRRAGTRRKA